MTGTFHIRMVAGILIAFSVLIVVSYAIGYFMDGELDSPAGLVGAIVNFVLVVSLCRGSNTAAYTLSAVSILGLAAWVLFLFAGFDGSALMAGVIAGGFVVTGYLWWAATFSKTVRAELARRREANNIPDRDTAKVLSANPRDS
jgi:hypothetical protein